MYSQKMKQMVNLKTMIADVATQIQGQIGTVVI